MVNVLTIVRIWFAGGRDLGAEFYSLSRRVDILDKIHTCRIE